ncbi:MAG: hypothetical protein U0T02_10210 [Solirubrobacteraceae bacterium]
MRTLRHTTIMATLGLLACAPAALADVPGGAVPGQVPGAQGDQGAAGGATFGVKPKVPASTPSRPTVAGSIARVRRGVAYAPADAPLAVRRVIWAGNKIRSTPYVWGGGHASWRARGYDCSGSVSYALHGARLVRSAMPSGDYMDWGVSGRGRWITIYANGGHMYMVVAGVRFDTSGAGAAGSRWQRAMRSGRGYAVRHPDGL